MEREKKCLISSIYRSIGPNSSLGLMDGKPTLPNQDERFQSCYILVGFLSTLGPQKILGELNRFEPVFFGALGSHTSRVNYFVCTSSYPVFNGEVLDYPSNDCMYIFPCKIGRQRITFRGSDTPTGPEATTPHTGRFGVAAEKYPKSLCRFGVRRSASRISKFRSKQGLSTHTHTHTHTAFTQTTATQASLRSSS